MNPVKMSFKTYAVQVSVGYLCDASEYMKGLALKYGEPTGADHYYSWYNPKAWSGKGEEWKAHVAEQGIDSLKADLPYYPAFIMDMSEKQFLEYCTHVSSPVISGTKEQEIEIPPNLIPDNATAQLRFMEQLLALNEKCIEQLTRAGTLCFNEKVGVNQPGLGLNQYNSLMLAEDICTDSLQQYLDEGWRIIAACPQPDSRRPDYVLGRFDATHTPNGRGAGRG